jgi:hypothetical protein
VDKTRVSASGRERSAEEDSGAASFGLGHAEGAAVSERHAWAGRDAPRELAVSAEGTERSRMWIWLRELAAASHVFSLRDVYALRFARSRSRVKVSPLWRPPELLISRLQTPLALRSRPFRPQHRAEQGASRNGSNQHLVV